MKQPKPETTRSVSPTFDLAISVDSLVMITKTPKKQILKLVSHHDLLSTGSLISYRVWTKKNGIIVKEGIRSSIVEKIFGPEVVKKFLLAGEDY